MDDDLIKFDVLAQELADKYSLGKSVYIRLNQLDSDDVNEIDAFFELLPNHEHEALIFYNSHLLEQKAKKSQADIPSTSPINDEKVDEILRLTKANTKEYSELYGNHPFFNRRQK